VIAESLGSSGTSTIIQLLVAMAGTGSLVAVVQGLFTRRKTRAEVAETGASATKVITDAAALLVATVQSDNVSLRAEIAALRVRVDRLQAWREAAEHNFEIHERWDEAMADAVRVCARDHHYVFAEMGGPPPLRPSPAR
jgi:hypothetical protein